MNKLSERQTDNNKITVGIDDLAAMIGVGKTTARMIGKESGALVKIGTRALYRVDKIKEYMESLAQ